MIYGFNYGFCFFNYINPDYSNTNVVGQCASFSWKNCYTVQIILMLMQIGFVFLKHNIISYFFI